MARRLYAYSFLSDCILLYPVYAVLFADSGLSAAEISSLFVIWSVTSFVVEVPSGVWADVVSRRRLVAAAPLVTGIGFVGWTVVPSYATFAAGFVLWGAGGALQSGAFEALVYAELERLGATSSYERLTGRARAFGTTGVLLASTAAVPVLAAGGYLTVGLASGIACLLASAVSLTLPDSRGRDADTDTVDEPGYLSTLREGVGELRRTTVVRRAVAVVVALTGLATLDEYIPLLFQATGADGPSVALLVAVVMVGSTLGGWFAGRGPRRLSTALAFGAGCLLLGGASGRAEVVVVLVALAYGTFEWTMIKADARLQEGVPDRVRATVTSFAGLGTEVAAVTAYAAYGLGSFWFGAGTLFAAAGAGYLVMTAGYRLLPEIHSLSRRRKAVDFVRGVVAGGRVGTGRLRWSGAERRRRGRVTTSAASGQPGDRRLQRAGGGGSPVARASRTSPLSRRENGTIGPQ